MRRIRFSLAILPMLALCACTVDVNTASVLGSDDEVKPLDIGALSGDGKERFGNMRIESLTMRHPDGVTTRGIHLIAPESRVVIVYLTGNKMRIRERGEMLLPRFVQLGVDVLWMDYRGLGASEGEASLDNLQADTAELIDLAASLHKKIVVQGLSMGSVLAVRGAQAPWVSGLVLEGGITSIPQVVDATMPEWAKLFLHVNIAPELSSIDNLETLQKYDRPLLVMVGLDDNETPPVLSKRLYAVASSSHKCLLEVPKAEHRTTMNFDQAIQSYRHFLEYDILAEP